MADFHHGARVIEVTDGVQSIATVATAVIGLLATAPDADVTVFPLNTPVLLTQLQASLAKAGTTGTLRKSLQAIADNVSAPVVVVRIEQGVDEAATTSNAVGGTDANGRYTGVKAFLTAEARCGVKPRILGAPGIDTEAVTVALATVAAQMRAFAYATCFGCDNVSDVLAYRETFGQRELMLIWPDFITWDTVANGEATDFAVARALGMRALIDQKYGWQKTLSNIVVNGVDGISKDVYWDLQTAGTDADLINEKGVTTLIGRNGYRFWGNRTCDDAQFIFETYTRTAQVLADTIAEGVFEYIDKAMHPSLVRDLIETINAKLRSLKNAGQILGAKAWYDPALNDPSNIKVGKLVISYDYTPLPPLEDLTLQQTFTDTYLADFAAAVNSGS